jgi:hypothetical protein
MIFGHAPIIFPAVLGVDVAIGAFLANTAYGELAPRDAR